MVSSPTYLPEKWGFSGSIINEGQQKEGGGQAASHPSAPSLVPTSSTGEGPWYCRTRPGSSPNTPSVGCTSVRVEGGCGVLPKLLLLSTAPSAPGGLWFSSHCFARLGGTFPSSSLVHQSKTSSHQGAKGPGAASDGLGTLVMPTHDTHAYLLP